MRIRGDREDVELMISRIGQNSQSLRISELLRIDDNGRSKYRWL